MSKIKVLHFSIANTEGGITKFILTLWEYIDKTRFQFDFVTFSKDLSFADVLELQGCKIYHMSTYAEDDYDTFAKELNKILDNHYDVLHLHTGWWRGFAIEEIAKKRGINKVVIHSHSTDVRIPEGADRNVARKLHNSFREQVSTELATDFLACSPEAAEWLYGDRIKDVKLIPNCIETELFKFDHAIRERIRAKLGYQESDIVLGHVGRFVYEKNHEFLIRVMKSVSSVNSDIKLLLIGKGQLEDEIKNLVTKYDLNDAVSFLGARHDVHELMQAMDIFVLPSRFEGFPIVLVEAQASGLSCIASSMITRSANITDLVDFEDLEEAKWTKCLLSKKSIKQREVYAGRVSEQGYDMDHLVEILQKIYIQ